tara:strand:+ start:1122 stop:2282 length:1161 start_codon:yes stop_codon:yes gene_type:complete
MAVAAVSVLGAYLLVVTGPQTQPEDKSRRPKSVRTVTVEASDQRITLRAHGIVTPVRRVTIAPEVTGLVIGHHPALIPGGSLQEGEELFSIDPTLVELNIKESQAAVTRAEASLEEARRKTVEAERLSVEKVIANSDLASIQAEERIQRAELQRLRVALERSQAMLHRHRVLAPFNSVVLNESVEIGQRVNPGFEAATLAGTDAFWVNAVVPVDQLQFIKLPDADSPGAHAEVYFDTGTETLQQRPGQVVQLLSDMEEQGRMARILIEVSDPLNSGSPQTKAPLLLGSYVRVEIDAGLLKGVLAIDRPALREGDTIWVVDRESQLRIRNPSVRWRTEDTVYIDDVINEGESLIISPLRVALPGMEVRANSVQARPAQAVKVTQTKP